MCYPATNKDKKMMTMIMTMTMVMIIMMMLICYEMMHFSGMPDFKADGAISQRVGGGRA